jgi:hypothetical protein
LDHSAWSRVQQVEVVKVTSAWTTGITIFNTQLTKDKRKRILVADPSPAVIANVPANDAVSHVATEVTVTTVAAPYSGKSIDVASTQPQALSPLGQLIKETKDAARRCDEKKSGVRKKLELVVSSFNRYAQCVDVLIQHHPDTTALVWGIMRTLVTVSFAHSPS